MSTFVKSFLYSAARNCINQKPPAITASFNKTLTRTWMSTAGIEKSHCAILFPGQGAQYVGMGKDLYASFASARKVFDEADDALGGGFKDLMFGGLQQKLTLTENAQPSIMTVSIAILRVLEEEFGFDVSSACTYALGHSLGEYSALVATKSISLYDAVKLVRLRGEAMSKTVSQRGVKTAIAAVVVKSNKLAELESSMDEIRASLPEGELVELANINSSFQVVISGTSLGVDHASRLLQYKQIAARAVDLPVSAPFHCVLMKPVSEELRKAFQEIKFQPPVVEIISNVTAKPIASVEDIPKLLAEQVTATIQWQRSIKYCKDRDIEHFIVFGPGRVLANLLKKEYPLDRIRSITTAEDIESHARELHLTKQTWDQEDYEIFDLVDQLENAEGKDVNFYSWLGLDETATDKEIGKARVIPVILHLLTNNSKTKSPDKNPDASTQEKFARLGSITAILRNADSRERYNFFLKNGVPRWRGTGYFYRRHRPGIIGVLTFLLILISVLHYLVMWINFYQERKRVQYYIQEAREVAWGKRMKRQETRKRVNVNDRQFVVEGDYIALLTDDGEEYPLDIEGIVVPRVMDSFVFMLPRWLYQLISDKMREGKIRKKGIYSNGLRKANRTKDTADDDHLLGDEKSSFSSDDEQSEASSATDNGKVRQSHKRRTNNDRRKKNRK
ncbi:9786_t:CDS:10 [Ambispora leptoticha]|uniref:[acyl-carrier-protein] S-malonyltransferase n=1 Tax=Ambispora leptoticha TaxID=144679 RepID=A0A9N8ZHN3_9GLOM|nr:9786_t:CDS:10 [Ambispora leptoticha]